MAEAGEANKSISRELGAFKTLAIPPKYLWRSTRLESRKDNNFRSLGCKQEASWDHPIEFEYGNKKYTRFYPCATSGNVQLVPQVFCLMLRVEQETGSSVKTAVSASRALGMLESPFSCLAVTGSTKLALTIGSKRVIHALSAAPKIPRLNRTCERKCRTERSNEVMS